MYGKIRSAAPHAATSHPNRSNQPFGSKSKDCVSTRVAQCERIQKENQPPISSVSGFAHTVRAVTSGSSESSVHTPHFLGGSVTRLANAYKEGIAYSAERMRDVGTVCTDYNGLWEPCRHLQSIPYIPNVTCARGQWANACLILPHCGQVL